MNLTYKYRIKDSVSRKKLEKLSGTVNFVWNYINELHIERLRRYRQSEKIGFFSAYDLHFLLNGAGKELKIAQQSLRRVAEQYVVSRESHKKSYLRWRSARKNSLGWIPFKHQDFKIKEEEITYCKEIYRIYKHRSLPVGAKIICGSFNQDSRGRWFVSVTFEPPEQNLPARPLSEVGIDLGVKSAMVLSDGTSVPRPDLTRLYADKLARAQRARKKKLTTNIYSKIRNSRTDYLHKQTTKIAKKFSNIYVGDVKASNLTHLNKGLTKNILDASWHRAKTLLAYKAVKLGGVFEEVSERWTTQDCSSCAERTGPKGLAGLSVREWKCGSCNTTHDRDTNSAKNILRLGHQALFQEIL